MLSQDDSGTKLLVALSSNCTIVKIPMSNMTAIHCGHNLSKSSLGADILFTRDFYENLLYDIRAQLRCVLIGNPGIGKSQFQFYYLARIMNPDLFGPLPPDSNGCTDAPKIVIRQVDNAMTIYDIERRVAYESTTASRELLKCFDPNLTVYFYEPGGEKEQEPFFSGLELPIFSTVSPNSKRYKEFTKNKAVKKYMPTYVCDELLAAGNYLLKENCVPDNMNALYSAKEIEKRHTEFGGIIRHVLPTSIEDLDGFRENRRLAIGNCNAREIMSSINTIEDGQVSSYIMAMDVERSGPNRFKKLKTVFISPDVEQQVERKVMEITLQERIELLMKNDQSGADDVRSRFLYESVLSTMFTTPPGVNWTFREAQSKEWKEYRLELKRIIRGPCPKFNEMESGVLYWPSEDSFPAVEFFYKSVKGRLIAFQVTRQQSNVKKITESAYRLFLQRVDLEDSTNVTLILVPLPAMANESSIGFVPFDTVPRVLSDSSLRKKTHKELSAYGLQNGFSIKFTKKAEFISEFRLFQVEAGQSASTPSTITWPEYSVLQVPTDYNCNIV